jgi:hypothetical protein
MRLTASHIQIIPEWQLVAYNFYPLILQSQATRIKSTVICLQLAAKRVQFAYDFEFEFECDWLPVACYFCTQLAATMIQFVCHWPPDANNFSTVWQTVTCKFTTGAQSFLLRDYNLILYHCDTLTLCKEPSR